jgi:metal-responsive CopG/Arc/MetJ family transcriptional regulator
MARREVLVQLDDQLVDKLDALAKRRHQSRSELLRQGAIAVLEADRLALTDTQLQKAYGNHPPDPELLSSAQRLAATNPPEW